MLPGPRGQSHCPHYNDRLAFDARRPWWLNRSIGLSSAPLDMTEFLRIAIALAGALRQAHEARTDS